MKKLDIISTNIRVDSLSWLYSLLTIDKKDMDSSREIFSAVMMIFPENSQEDSKLPLGHNEKTR